MFHSSLISHDFVWTYWQGGITITQRVAHLSTKEGHHHIWFHLKQIVPLQIKVEWKSPFSSLVKFCFAPTPYFGLSCNNCLPLLLSFLDSSCCHSVPTTPKKFYIWDLICSKCCHVIKTHTYTHTHTHTLSLSLSLSLHFTFGT